MEKLSHRESKLWDLLSAVEALVIVNQSSNTLNNLRANSAFKDYPVTGERLRHIIDELDLLYHDVHLVEEMELHYHELPSAFDKLSSEAKSEKLQAYQKLSEGKK